MKAYKCDRCGKLFEEYNSQGTVKFFNITRNPNISSSCLDLCSNCNAELQEWVGNDRDVEAVKDLLPQEELVINQRYSPVDFCTYGECPTCGEIVSGFTIGSPNLYDKECPKCGQKLKWQ